MLYADPAALFAGTAHTYLRYRIAHPPSFMDHLAHLAPAGTVLDLGCGPGSVALALAERGRDVVAVDANPDMIEAACVAAADRSLSGHVDWRVGDVHDLSGLPTVAGVNIGDAFHWFDRAAVLRQLDQLVVDGGFVAVVMSFTACIPKPWWYPLVDRVVHRHLGPARFAGPGVHYREPAGGDHEAVLRASVFNHLTVIRTDQHIRMDLEQVIGNQYTQAYTSPPVLGDRLAAFDHDLRALLTAAEPSGVFTAMTQPGLIIARRGEDQ
ncbi:class I SAM-dependent methyltransferase [Phytohabitans rumicis]|uniref:Methyltransferase n=1 Tax=Phytohabitans rumicis TaxID=1076125 RepID=A0A6V8L4N9_9ACTN|nr:class I SAM-dependent methyltransferase [Phytohabitans rumicis]GFJ92233.1 methyltransferase [Phytohabitans rumicis]